MTDARLPERWLSDRRFLRLSDGAYRLYMTALLWSVANRSDGVLFEDDLPLLARADTSCTDELAAAGLWRHDAGLWVIEDHAATQTSRSDLEVLENERRRQREKSRRNRAARAVGNPVDNTSTEPVDNPRTGYGTGDQYPGASPARVPVTPLGKDRTGVVVVPTELQPTKQNPVDDVDPGSLSAVVDLEVTTPRTRARGATGSRLPDDWTPDAGLVAWSRAEGIPDDLAREETAKFADYWRATPGAKGRKADWPATWRNWMRRATESARHPAGGNGRRNDIDWDAALRRAQARGDQP